MTKPNQWGKSKTSGLHLPNRWRLECDELILRRVTFLPADLKVRPWCWCRSSLIDVLFCSMFLEMDPVHGRMETSVPWWALKGHLLLTATLPEESTRVTLPHSTDICFSEGTIWQWTENWKEGKRAKSFIPVSCDSQERETSLLCQKRLFYKFSLSVSLHIKTFELHIKYLCIWITQS